MQRPYRAPYLEDAVHVDHHLGPLGRVQRRGPQHLLLVLQQALADGVYLGHLRGERSQPPMAGAPATGGDCNDPRPTRRLSGRARGSPVRRQQRVVQTSGKARKVRTCFQK